MNNKMLYKKLEGKSLLITGANGMIASELVDRLIEINRKEQLNIHIYALCRNADRAKKRFEKAVSNGELDLIIQDVIEPLTCNIDFSYIIHAASMAYPFAMTNQPVDIMKANFIGTLNMLEYARKCTKCRLLLVSSSEVYGDNIKYDILHEDTLGEVEFMNPRACYPESKRASETLCHSYIKQYGCDAVIVRPSFIYGKNIVDDNTRADVYFLRQGMKKEDIVMFSEGTQVREYCYVKDCVDAIIVALLNGQNGETYNISNNDCAITIRGFAEAIAKHAGIKVVIDESVKPQNTNYLGARLIKLDTSKIQALGWMPRYDIDMGLTDIFGR